MFEFAHKNTGRFSSVFAKRARCTKPLTASEDERGGPEYVGATDVICLRHPPLAWPGVELGMGRKSGRLKARD